MSKFEDKAAAILKANGFKFKREVSFPNLNGGKGIPLRFDFAVFKNNQFLFLLEIDGKQHYEFTPFFHKTIFDFKKQKEWDRKKNKYCLVHKIPLIRIPYWTEKTLNINDFFNCEYLVKNKNHIDISKKGGQE